MASELYQRLNPPRRFRVTCTADLQNPSPNARPLHCNVTDTKDGSTVVGSRRETAKEAQALADELEAADVANRQRAAYHLGEVERYLATQHVDAGVSWRPGEHDGITVSAEWLHAILIEHEATRA
jgi:hypothetical protein